MLIERLKRAGVRFEAGMTTRELDAAEEFFGFRFPGEIREFLSRAVPVGKDFFDYRDHSEENKRRFEDFQAGMEKSFRFDLERNRDDMLEQLGEKLGFAQDGPGFDEAVIHYWRESPRLIPLFAHRCFFDGMDDMPIISFWQPVDTIVYGFDLEDYLESEFLRRRERRKFPQDLLKDTGIWEDLIW